ncbi:MAG: carbohydrate kinase family protein [Chloroflexota bacterium]|nr:carbohydrate kinase family protein [Chloroflexota bacterium]
MPQTQQDLQTIVFGNVTLDIICYPVDDVPRHDSISFDNAIISPGGCASNTAIGLAALGIPTGIIAHTGSGDAATLLRNYWKRTGVDTRFIGTIPDTSTGISVGLVDHKLSPRFIHTSGANATLTAAEININALISAKARHLHIAGFFVLPGLLDNQLGEKLATLQSQGLTISLDVVFNQRMNNPKLRAALWNALPHLNHFLCNDYEAFLLTGEKDPARAARSLRKRGVPNVIVKLGEKGCWLEGDSVTAAIPTPVVNVVDTTGAGDAFAAGFIAALSRGSDIESACRAGNKAGAHICTRLGAIQAWLDETYTDHQ